MRVLVQETKMARTRHPVGEVDGMPTDKWLADHGVNPSSVEDRKVVEVKGERFWLVVVSR